MVLLPLMLLILLLLLVVRRDPVPLLLNTTPPLRRDLVDDHAYEALGQGPHHRVAVVAAPAARKRSRSKSSLGRSADRRMYVWGGHRRAIRG